VHFIPPEAALGEAGGRDDALVGVEPDRAHAQARAAANVPDGVALVHTRHCGISSDLRVKGAGHDKTPGSCFAGLHLRASTIWIGDLTQTAVEHDSIRALDSPYFCRTPVTR